MGRMSLATIASPEFINLQPLDINPLMSACEIKVLYVGQNRNQSFISKEVATEMSKTLRGAPIVGWFRDEKQDFGDHGDQLVWDADGLRFNCLTRPYGFVAPDAKVWFQKFNDTDEFGNTVEREYLMTTGYLWTGQFEEAAVALQGKGQSMELDDRTMDGHWSTDLKSGLDFFIINDAIFTKLCILGDDVEPCFEGANVTAPDISKNFSKSSEDFTKTLFTMMQELKFALEGGQKMDKDKIPAPEQNNEDPTKFSAGEDKGNQAAQDKNDNTIGEQFEKKDPDKEKDKEKDPETKPEDDKKDGEKKDKEDDEEEKKKYSLLEQKYAELETKYNALLQENASLAEFKNQIDNEKKDALISSFSMLSDEDKQDVIENKTKYSLDEIEAKLSVICFRKKVDFSGAKEAQEEKQPEPEKPAVTFSLGEGSDGAPAWVIACRQAQNGNN